MLVLSRKPGSSISLSCPDGSVINVHILRSRRRGISIGIEALESIGIIRDDAKSGAKSFEAFEAVGDNAFIDGLNSLPESA